MTSRFVPVPWEFCLERTIQHEPLCADPLGGGSKYDNDAEYA